VIRRLARNPIAVAVVLAAIVLVVAAWASLQWRYVKDSPLMIYAGFLLAHGAVPYRDFFDMNMPGTYFVMAAVGKLAGWNDVAFRVFDVLCIACVSASTLRWMWSFGRLPALAASVAFPLWYLNAGAAVALQREHIALVPFAAMLAVIVPNSGWKPGWRFFVAGVLVGAAMLVKPQFILLAIPPLVFALTAGIPAPARRRLAALWCAGIAVPLGTVLGYLVATRSLQPFLDIATHYWPLYSHMTGLHETLDGKSRWMYIARSLRDGLTTFFAPLPAIGLMVAGRDPALRRETRLVCALVVAAALYPAFAGQFWDYHWIPFRYVALCATLIAARVAVAEIRSIANVVPAVAVIALLLSLAWISVDRLRWALVGSHPDGLFEFTVADPIAKSLRARMQPGDTVQPLDWAGGAVHGMLMAGAPLGTRFMYDFHFYHHVSKPYIRTLRREFVAELAAKPPRFVVAIPEHRAWPHGADTTREFPELNALLENQYTIVEDGGAYRILERRAAAPAATQLLSPAR
jgi:hypothetical protein